MQTLLLLLLNLFYKDVDFRIIIVEIFTKDWKEQFLFYFVLLWFKNLLYFKTIWKILMIKLMYDFPIAVKLYFKWQDKIKYLNNFSNEKILKKLLKTKKKYKRKTRIDMIRKYGKLKVSRKLLNRIKKYNIKEKKEEELFCISLNKKEKISFIILLEDCIEYYKLMKVERIKDNSLDVLYTLDDN